MDALSVASVIMGFNFAFSFVSIFRFYRRRASKTPIDQRSALTPTLIISISFLLGLISTAVSFYSLLILPSYPPPSLPPPWNTTLYPMELVSELAIPLFGFALTIAVVASLKRPKLYALPALLLSTCFALSYLSPKHPLDDPYLSLWVAMVSLLLIIPMVLFAYLWRKTKRPTALGMFVGLILYFAYYLYYTRTLSEYVGRLGFYYVSTEYLGHVEQFDLLINLMPVMIFVGVASLSLIYWCFQYSDRKLGGEVLGYSFTIPVVSIELYFILMSLGIVPIEYAANLLVTAVAAGIFILTGSYVYGRYRESRSKQTLALSIFAYFAGLDFLLFAIMQNIYLQVGRQPWMNLITLPVGILTGGFLFVAAMYAIDRPSLVLVPALIIAPLLIMELFFNPMPFWLLIIMAGAGVSLSVVPGVMFGILWRRMSKGKEKGRGRILGIFLGFICVLLSSPVETLSATVEYPIAFIASYIGLMGAALALAGALLFFLGISGRFDRWIYERKKK
jgi:hypothetical protein